MNLLLLSFLVYGCWTFIVWDHENCASNNLNSHWGFPLSSSFIGSNLFFFSSSQFLTAIAVWYNFTYIFYFRCVCIWVKTPKVVIVCLLHCSILLHMETGSLLNLKFVNSVSVSQSVSPKNLYLCLSNSGISDDYHTHPDFMWVWGSDVSYSHLHSKQFIH